MDIEQCTIRPLSAADDAALARIIRTILRACHLDIPGTAYFDPELDHLSSYYVPFPDRRAYFVAVDAQGTVLGGAGLAESVAFADCAELQKLYVTEQVRRRGLGRALMEACEARARALHYRKMYLETHSVLTEALHYRKMYLETHSVLTEALQLYTRLGYREIPRPEAVLHTTMDRFFIKDLV